MPACRARGIGFVSAGGGGGGSESIWDSVGSPTLDLSHIFSWVTDAVKTVSSPSPSSGTPSAPRRTFDALRAHLDELRRSEDEAMAAPDASQPPGNKPGTLDQIWAWVKAHPEVVLLSVAGITTVYVLKRR